MLIRNSDLPHHLEVLRKDSGAGRGVEPFAEICQTYIPPATYYIRYTNRPNNLNVICRFRTALVFSTLRICFLLHASLKSPELKEELPLASKDRYPEQLLRPCLMYSCVFNSLTVMLSE